MIEEKYEKEVYDKLKNKYGTMISSNIKILIDALYYFYSKDIENSEEGICTVLDVCNESGPRHRIYYAFNKDNNNVDIDIKLHPDVHEDADVCVISYKHQKLDCGNYFAQKYLESIYEIKCKPMIFSGLWETVSFLERDFFFNSILMEILCNIMHHGMRKLIDNEENK